MRLQKGARRGLSIGIVHAQEDHLLLIDLLPGLLQESGFVGTGSTPGSPEIDQDGFPAQVTQRNGLPVKSGQREIRHRAAYLQRLRLTFAQAHAQQDQKAQQDHTGGEDHPDRQKTTGRQRRFSHGNPLNDSG